MSQKGENLHTQTEHAQPNDSLQKGTQRKFTNWSAGSSEVGCGGTERERQKPTWKRAKVAVESLNAADASSSQGHLAIFLTVRRGGGAGINLLGSMIKQDMNT